MVVAAPASTPKVTSTAAAVQRLYLQHGHRANAFSVAFDPDLDRYVSPLGVLAHARCAWLRTTVVYYDPLCADADLPALVDEFLATQGGRSIAFWKAGAVSSGFA